MESPAPDQRDQQDDSGPEDSSILDDVESPAASEDAKVQPKKGSGVDGGKKRRRSSYSQLPIEVKSLTDMASSATKVLSSIANKTSVGDAAAGDSDWEFCKFLYSKLKTITDEGLKDELLLEITRLVCVTKRRSANQGTDPPSSFSSTNMARSIENVGSYSAPCTQSFPSQTWQMNQQTYQQYRSYSEMIPDVGATSATATQQQQTYGSFRGMLEEPTATPAGGQFCYAAI